MGKIQTLSSWIMTADARECLVANAYIPAESFNVITVFYLYIKCICIWTKYPVAFDNLAVGDTVGI